MVHFCKKKANNQANMTGLWVHNLLKYEVKSQGFGLVGEHWSGKSSWFQSWLITFNWQSIRLPTAQVLAL